MEGEIDFDPTTAEGQENINEAVDDEYTSLLREDDETVPEWDQRGRGKFGRSWGYVKSRLTDVFRTKNPGRSVPEYLQMEEPQGGRVEMVRQLRAELREKYPNHNDAIVEVGTSDTGRLEVRQGSGKWHYLQLLDGRINPGLPKGVKKALGNPNVQLAKASNEVEIAHTQRDKTATQSVLSNPELSTMISAVPPSAAESAEMTALRTADANKREAERRMQAETQTETQTETVQTQTEAQADFNRAVDSEIRALQSEPVREELSRRLLTTTIEQMERTRNTAQQDLRNEVLPILPQYEGEILGIDTFDKMTKDLQIAEGDLAVARYRLNSVIPELERKTAEMEAAKTRISELQRQEARLREEPNQLTEELASARRELKAVKADYADTQKDRDELAAARSRVAELERKQAKLVTTPDRLTRELATVRQELEKAKADYVDLQADKAAADVDAQKQLKLLINGHAAEMQKARDGSAEISQKLYKLRKERNEILRREQQLTDQLQQVEQSLTTAQEQLTGVQEQLETSNGQLAVAQGKVDVKDTEIQDLRQRLATAEGTEAHAAVGQQLEARQEELRNAEQQREQAEQAVQRLQAQEETLQARIQELEQHRTRTEEELGLTTKDKIKRALVKYGVPVAFAVALSSAVGVIVDLLKATGNGVKKVGQGLTDLGKKMAASIPGLLGSVLSLVLKTGGELLKFVGNNVWILVVALGAVLIKRLK